jgi:RNA polymerase sigma factor (sigma-70 family)
MSSSAARAAGVQGQERMDGRRLSADRERALLQIVRHGGSARDRQQALALLWQSHGGLVAAVASRYRRAGIDIEDLIGAGQLGLHAAIVRFDAARFPGRLSTYAVPWIRWYVQDHVSRNALPVRLPATIAHRQLARSGGQLFADARRACHREQVEPTEMELCARVGSRIGLSADEVASSRYTGGNAVVSLDEDTVIDLGGAPTPEDDTIQRLDREKLRRRILTLADTILGQREREVFLARCMTGDAPISRLDELGARFGVSRERIYQLESSARRKIITVLRQEGFADLPDQTAPEGEADVCPAPLAVGQLRSR